jgi:HK97 family phage prohead protease
MAKTQKGQAAIPDNCERRVLVGEDMELRISDDGPTKMSGYAARFNKWSNDLGGFTEKIAPGAFDEALVDCDVRGLKNHDPNLLLGRTTSGTLRLDANARGLKFDLDIPETSTGRDTAEEIRRGDISGCSFGFTTSEDDWKYLEDGRIQRTIIKVAKLFDVGPVTFPAYPDTTVAARSLDAFKDSQEAPTPPPEQPQLIDDKRQRQAGRAYRKLGRFLNRFRSTDA